VGKGDTPRKVNKDKFDENFDSIDWSKRDTTKQKGGQQHVTDSKQ